MGICVYFVIDGFNWIFFLCVVVVRIFECVNCGKLVIDVDIWILFVLSLLEKMDNFMLLSIRIVVIKWFVVCLMCGCILKVVMMIVVVIRFGFWEFVLI